MHFFYARFSLLFAPLLAIGLTAEPAGAKPISFGMPTPWDWTRMGMEAWGRLQDVRGGGPILPGRSGPVRGSRGNWVPQHGHGYDPHPGYDPHHPPYDPHYAEPEYHHTPAPPNPAPAAGSQPARNPLPGHARVPGQIRPIGDDFARLRGGAIVNPAENEVDLNYVLDGRSYTLPPGYYQDLGYGRDWVIEFHRGGPFGSVKYTVGNVKHVFTPTEKGWELVRREPKS